MPAIHMYIHTHACLLMHLQKVEPFKYNLGLCLMCLKFNLLFFPAIPKKFTHYSYFMFLSLPIILIKFFLAILHAGSSGVVNVVGAAVKRVL